MSDSSTEEVQPMKNQPENEKVVCPVCGAATVQEKCKVICQSEVCRGRVIYNCAEF